MVFTTVGMRVHGAGSQEFLDEVIDGKFYNFGVQALAALKAHKTIDVHFPEMDGDSAVEMIIPYHAVMAWVMRKEEDEYTKPEDDFCKSESTPTGDITLLDGTYEFTGDETVGLYRAESDKCYQPANVMVTVDGTTATLPEFVANKYGEFGDGGVPVFTTYPAAVELDRQDITVYVETAGSHTIKVTVPNSSEVDCGGK